MAKLKGPWLSGSPVADSDLVMSRLPGIRKATEFKNSHWTPHNLKIQVTFLYRSGRPFETREQAIDQFSKRK